MWSGTVYIMSRTPQQQSDDTTGRKWKDVFSQQLRNGQSSPWNKNCSLVLLLSLDALWYYLSYACCYLNWEVDMELVYLELLGTNMDSFRIEECVFCKSHMHLQIIHSSLFEESLLFDLANEWLSDLRNKELNRFDNGWTFIFHSLLMRIY